MMTPTCGDLGAKLLLPSKDSNCNLGLCLYPCFSTFYPPALPPELYLDNDAVTQYLATPGPSTHLPLDPSTECAADICDLYMPRVLPSDIDVLSKYCPSKDVLYSAHNTLGYVCAYLKTLDIWTMASEGLDHTVEFEESRQRYQLYPSNLVRKQASIYTVGRYQQILQKKPIFHASHRSLFLLDSAAHNERTQGRSDYQLSKGPG